MIIWRVDRHLLIKLNTIWKSTVLKILGAMRYLHPLLLNVVMRLPAAMHIVMQVVLFAAIRRVLVWATSHRANVSIRLLLFLRRRRPRQLLRFGNHLLFCSEHIFGRYHQLVDILWQRTYADLCFVFVVFQQMADELLLLHHFAVQSVMFVDVLRVPDDGPAATDSCEYFVVLAAVGSGEVIRCQDRWMGHSGLDQ